MRTIKAEHYEESDVKGIRISDEALIEIAKKGEICFNAQNLGSVSRPMARMGINEKGEQIVLERYDE